MAELVYYLGDTAPIYLPLILGSWFAGGCVVWYKHRRLKVHLQG